MKSAGDGDCIVITAGLRRQADESRLDLINRNVVLFRGILAELKPGIRKDAIVFRRFESSRCADLSGD